ncbi:hypothetical protein YPPY89_2500 [Yersinia pestis PY-89]|nr:hypothetical protein YPPY89_2500 [Yersinia pestis PY-89]
MDHGEAINFYQIAHCWDDDRVHYGVCGEANVRSACTTCIAAK